MRSLLPSHCVLLPLVCGCDVINVVGLEADAAVDAAPARDSSSDARVIDAPSDAAACASTESTTLAGAHIVLDAAPCRFTLAEAAAGITFPYRVVVDHDIDGVVSLPQDAGRCNMPDETGLSVFSKIQDESTSHVFCRCDVGPCPFTEPPPATVHAGVHASQVSWNGRAWSGPSDTGNPMGAPFPPGNYVVHVSARGEVLGDAGTTPFEVFAERGIVLLR